MPFPALYASVQLKRLKKGFYQFEIRSEKKLLFCWLYLYQPDWRPVREILSVSLSASQGNQCLLSHFLASLGAQEKTNSTSMLDQLTPVKTGFPLTSINWPYRGLKCRPIEVDYFWSYPLTNYQFQMIAGSSLFFPRIHIKYVVFMSLWPRTIKILISNWPRTRKFSQFFKNTGGEDLFSPWSPCTSIFMLWLVKIWQMGSGGKFM